ncbi:phosphoribosylanthranilate isomerase [Natribacillus halophilus]|uniref:N-(5'-phosphoribosyl)anthranilate isomerase n=1 Tax=Natribacillus halophilus TaxID=549003 RepID=A0A1G8JBJ0_9BACI|nr:phosphoribosylanthranilate isomerase [Natribacillus halophilus]SDI28638.1 phosphoribosylanthranilate isomerase [Natribacillus halophilus]
MTDIKFCGLQSEEDVQNAVAAGASALGFVFADSKRQVAPEAVNAWLESVSLHDQQTVAVCVNPDHADVAAIIDIAPLDTLQFHGDEPPQFLKEVKAKTGKRVIKAFRHQKGTLDQLSAFAPVVDGFLLDAGTKAQRGGTGRRFDWKAVPIYVHFARQLNRPLWIAGGISPDNIAGLLAHHPDGIDIASGIEKEKRKDVNKMEAIVKQVSADDRVLS